jgi:phospholipase/carboxylesterase
MKPIATTLVHRVLEPEAAGPGPHPLLLFLHGRGADEEDLLGLAPLMDPRFLIVSARAPLPFHAGGGYTWYHLNAIGSPDQQTFRKAYELLVRFFDDIRGGYPVDTAQVFLYGFSMGAVMSFSLGLTRPESVRGIVAHSGYIPEDAQLPLRWSDLARTGFFIAHGTSDPVIPVSRARRAKDLLTPTAARFDVREYPMSHTISDQSASESAAWLRAALGTEEPY